MAEHAARDHAKWSASATDRNWHCPGALALTDGLPETTSEAADWGTVCHEVCEISLIEGTPASDLLGTTRKGKQFEFEVDDEMVETADVYLKYVREHVVAAAPKGVNPTSLLTVEQQFSLASLNPPFEAGGTADAVIYYPAEKLLEVVDLKTGKGVVVEAKGNPQLRTYGLGALLANPKLDVERVRTTIVQPRAGHKDGHIRSDTIHVTDLVEWTSDLVAAMRRSAQAMADFEKIGSTVSKAEWETAHLDAGSHCKFCKAGGFCPARERKALDAAGVWFDDLDAPRISNQPDAMSPEQAAKTLDMLDMISEWVNAVRAYWHERAEAGVEIPGYQLVEKVGNRAWTKPEEEIAGTLLLEGLADEQIYNRKIVSPAQAEKLLGAKRKKAIDGLFERPVRGTNLVAIGKTTRPAATPAVAKHFDILD